jgi:hypothetical protein
VPIIGWKREPLSTISKFQISVILSLYCIDSFCYKMSVLELNEDNFVYLVEW